MSLGMLLLKVTLFADRPEPGGELPRACSGSLACAPDPLGCGAGMGMGDEGRVLVRLAA